MYSVLPSFVLGFHGCDKSVAERVFQGKDTLTHSTNEYDWLGPGVYFWENDYVRAMEFALDHRKRKPTGTHPIKNPAVVGAVIDLGRCLNLLERGALERTREAFLIAKEVQKKLPPNRHVKPTDKNRLLRDRDCLVIKWVHVINSIQGKPMYDTVRGVFVEGENLYPGAGFQHQNHIQIAVRNPNCIKGYFRVRSQDKSFSLPNAHEMKYKLESMKEFKPLFDSFMKNKKPSKG